MVVVLPYKRAERANKKGKCTQSISVPGELHPYTVIVIVLLCGELGDHTP